LGTFQGFIEGSEEGVGEHGTSDGRLGKAGSKVNNSEISPRNTPLIAGALPKRRHSSWLQQAEAIH
jgi:hypothetical protein